VRRTSCASLLRKSGAGLLSADIWGRSNYRPSLMCNCYFFSLGTTIHVPLAIKNFLIQMMH
jgi:hypothetical protein